MIGSGPGATWRTGWPASSSRRRPCQPTATIASSDGTSAQAGGSSAATGARIQPGRRPPGVRNGLDRDGIGVVAAELEPALGPLDVDEDRAVLERDEMDVDAGLAQEIELGRGRRPSASTPMIARRRQPEPGRRQGAVRDAAAEPPAARVVVGEVARRRSRRRRPSASAAGAAGDGVASRARSSAVRRRGRGGRVRYWRSIPSPSRPEAGVYFYELHEGDEDVFSDVLLVRDDEMDPDEFFELVQSVRRQVQDTYDDDTLIEAIAAELEREHGFVFISDDRLTRRGQRVADRRARTSSSRSTGRRGGGRGRARRRLPGDRRRVRPDGEAGRPNERDS